MIADWVRRGGAVALPISQHVVWRDLVKCEVVPDGFEDNTLRRSVGPSAWDAGAFSTARLNSGDGWIEMIFRNQASDPLDQAWLEGSFQKFGFNNSSSGHGANENEFGLYIASNSRLFANEGAGQTGPVDTLTGGDVIRADISGTVVTIKVNGGTVHTFSGSPSYPLYVGSDLNNYTATPEYQSAGIYKPRISAGGNWSIW